MKEKELLLKISDQLGAIIIKIDSIEKKFDSFNESQKEPKKSCYYPPFDEFFPL